MLAGESNVTEQRMMGALVILVNGNMCCGVTGAALMVRVCPEVRDGPLSEPHVRPMEIGGGRQPRGFVCIDPPGVCEQRGAEGVDRTRPRIRARASSKEES